MPRSAKCFTFCKSFSIARPFSIPIISDFTPLRLLRSKSSRLRAKAMYRESLSTISSILSKIRSA